MRTPVKTQQIGYGLQSRVYLSEDGMVVKKISRFDPCSRLGLAFLRSYAIGIARIPEQMPKTSVVGNTIFQERVELFDGLIRTLPGQRDAHQVKGHLDDFIAVNRRLWEKGLTLSFDARFLNFGYRKGEESNPLVLDAGRLDDKLTVWNALGVLTAHAFNFSHLAKLDLLRPLESLDLALYYAGQAWREMNLLNYVRLLGSRG